MRSMSPVGPRRHLLLFGGLVVGCGITASLTFLAGAADATPAPHTTPELRRLPEEDAALAVGRSPWRSAELRTLDDLLTAAATVVRAAAEADHVARTTVAVELADQQRRAVAAAAEATARAQAEAAARLAAEQEAARNAAWQPQAAPVGASPGSGAGSGRSLPAPAAAASPAPVAPVAPASTAPAPAPTPAPAAVAAPPVAAPPVTAPPVTAAPPPAPVLPDADSLAGTFFALVNQERAAVGLPPLAFDGGLAGLARAQSGRISAAGSLFHQDLGSVLAQGWSRAGENVGYGPSASRLHAALAASAAHYANMVNASFSALGVGVSVSADGQIWVAEVFGG